MRWAGYTFSHVPVVTVDGEYTIMETGRAIRYAYKKRRFRGVRGIWSQPIGPDKQLLPVYYGPVPIRFTGQLTPNGSTSLSSARIMVQRLSEQGVPDAAIDILLAGEDVYVLVNAKSLGLSPDPQFPTWCSRIAGLLAQGLPYDNLYRPGAMMPIEGSRLDDGSYVVMIRPVDLQRTDHALLFMTNRRKPLHGHRNIDRGHMAEQYHPLQYAVKHRARRDLPDRFKGLFEMEHKNVDDACFAIALATKDIGGTETDALCLVNTLPQIGLISDRRKRRTLARAFLKQYRFGYRAFSKRFPGIAQAVPAQKSQFVIIERSWFKKLTEAKAPHTVHRLLYELICEYHDYPRPLLPMPENWSSKLLRPAIRTLTDLGIVAREGNQVRLLIDYDARESTYLRLPIEYLHRAIESKRAIRFFTALSGASLHKKTGQWTTIRIETLANRMGVSVRTAFEYLRSLRSGGIQISEKLSIEFPISQSQNEAADATQQALPLENESIPISLITKEKCGAYRNTRPSAEGHSLLGFSKATDPARYHMPSWIHKARRNRLLRVCQTRAHRLTTRSWVPPGVS